MKSYIIEVTKIVNVKAISKDEALKKARKEIKKGLCCVAINIEDITLSLNTKTVLKEIKAKIRKEKRARTL